MLENRFIQSIIIIYIFIIFLKITTAQILGFGGHGVTHGHEERVNTGAKNFFEKCILIHLNVFKACGRGGDKKNDLKNLTLQRTACIRSLDIIDSHLPSDKREFTVISHFKMRKNKFERTLKYLYN